MVYFLKLENTPYVKIGYTADLDNRLRKLRSDNPHPVTVLGRRTGGRREERFYHSLFKNSHVHGDWFHESPELLKLIRERCA
jgi:hypothetical protein